MVVSAVEEHDVRGMRAKVSGHGLREIFGVLAPVALMRQRADAGLALLGAGKLHDVARAEKHFPKRVTVGGEKVGPGRDGVAHGHDSNRSGRGRGGGIGQRAEKEEAEKQAGRNIHRDEAGRGWIIRARRRIRGQLLPALSDFSNSNVSDETTVAHTKTTPWLTHPPPHGPSSCIFAPALVRLAFVRRPRAALRAQTATFITSYPS